MRLFPVVAHTANLIIRHSPKYITTAIGGGFLSQIKNSSESVTGYVVVIYYNDKPVGIQFDANGTFVKVLEQREKEDLEGNGWHHGGRFEGRGGKQKDTLALSALPSSVRSYLIVNYASDTLLKAYKNRDSSYMVLSKNHGLFATVFSADANFIKRVQLPSKGGNCNGIEQTALPASILSYLNTTYPNYIFNKAFSVTNGSAIKSYVVFIDAHNNRYAITFDVNGSFVEVKTIY
jgi:hypothetical protein